MHYRLINEHGIVQWVSATDDLDALARTTLPGKVQLYRVGNADDEHSFLQGVRFRAFERCTRSMAAADAIDLALRTYSRDELRAIYAWAKVHAPRTPQRWWLESIAEVNS